MMMSHDLAHRILSLPNLIVETNDNDGIEDVILVDFVKGDRIILVKEDSE